MKKILFLEQFAAISGGQVVLLQVLDGLDRTKFTPFVVVPAKGPLTDELKKRRIPYIILPIGNYSVGRKSLWDKIKYLFLSLLLIPLTYLVIKKHEIDLLYANAPRTYLWATLAANLCRKPIVWHVHSFIPKIEVWFLQKLKVNKIIAISQAVAKPFSKLQGKIEVIYNGVQLKKFDPKIVRQELKIPADYKVVGFIGQLAYWKGIEDYIRAAALVLKKYPQAIFLIVGEAVFGQKKEKAYLDKLKNLVEQQQITDKIMFLGRREDIPQVLAALDMLVVPSVEPEPLSLALLEGMAAGKAVVVAAHGGMVEVVDDNVTGLLFYPGNVEDLSDKIISLLNDSNKANTLGQNAGAKVAANFSLHTFQQNIVSVLQQELLSQ